MKINVLFFAMCREAANTDRVELSLPENARLDEFWTAVEKRFPSMSVFRSMSRIAINKNYVGSNAVLSDGDEVCIIPPVSGG